jgi:hypothetical protein
MTVRENLQMGCYLRSHEDSLDWGMTPLFEA